MKHESIGCRTGATRIFLMASGALLVTLAGGALPARAQSGSGQVARSYDIPAQPLGSALRDYMRQSGVQVGFPSEIGEGITTATVRGSFSAAEALSRLLTGTGLTYRFTGANTVTLERAPQVTGDAIQLGPVRVEGDTNGIAGSGIAASVTSDPDATEATGSFTTRRMSSATKMPLTLRETPQAVTVITNARIEQENLVDLVDIATIVPGVFVDYFNARPVFTARGREIDRLTQNGIPILHDTTIPSSLGNMAMQDRVEVVRGATGLMQGGGNPSGALNLIRKRPTRQFVAMASASAGSWNDYRLTADIGGPLTADGRIRARAVGFFQEAGNFRDIEFNDSRLGYLTVDIDLADRTTMNIGYSYLYTHQNSIWGAIPLNPNGTHRSLPRSTYPGTDWEYGDNRVHTVYASLAHDFGAGWSLQVNATYVDSATDMLATNFRPLDDSVATLSHAWWKVNKDRDQKAVDAYASGPLSLFGRDHQIVFGGTVDRETSRDVQWFRGFDDVLTTGVDLAAWNHRARYPNIGEPTFRDRTHNNQDSLYASGRFSILDRLALVLGSRLDWYDRTVFYAGGGSVDGRLTKYAGLTWDFEAHHSAYVSYTDVFQPQAITGIDGSLLPPVIGRNYEAGIKGEYLNGALNTGLILFRTDETNRAVLLLDQNGCVTAPISECSAATGLVRTWGIDSEVQGEVAPGWQIGAGFTFADTRYVRDEDYGAAGDRLDTGSPTTQFKLSTQYRLPGALNRLTLGGRVNWQSRIYYDFENVSGVAVRNQQPAYAVIDLSATYRPAQRLSVQLEVNNLLDKAYYRSIGQGYRFSAHEIFGAPRNVLATLRYRLQ
ncbi:TonB-dependent siderophore receptor [Sphingomonas sp. 2R-10]|uniref:TonB-dependent siderophore receptor n=1 Tax=Sphingomonas sp. 2R-10 TaxID=3045148 RepID=UPI000F7A5BE9|nr:TonB-dependent receptor [Sphingomonas sp. 2R-10]MDJ0275273.1 TonB-dependent siderophore receptor [Sphingomonas sp. 2R-10]